MKLRTDDEACFLQDRLPTRRKHARPHPNIFSGVQTIRSSCFRYAYLATFLPVVLHAVDALGSVRSTYHTHNRLLLLEQLLPLLQTLI